MPDMMSAPPASVRHVRLSPSTSMPRTTAAPPPTPRTLPPRPPPPPPPPSPPAPPPAHRPPPLHRLREDEPDARHAQKRARHPRRRQSLARQVRVRDQHAEDGYGRL